MRPYRHTPVLLDELVRALVSADSDHFHCIDATVGGGGHAEALLTKSAPDGRLLGLDLDPRAVRSARQRLKRFGSRVKIVQASYADLTTVLQKNTAFRSADGIVIDLGISSDQVDAGGRGFSFQETGVVGMRFDGGETETASDLLLRSSAEELERIFRTYGELPNARRLAKAIVEDRAGWQASGLVLVPMLTKTIDRASRGHRGRIHPATLAFQALRIAVNQELRNLEVFLPQAIRALRPGGILAVISYHSLEDRMVKNFFRREATDCICPPRHPVCRCTHRASLTVLTRKPVRPTASEVARNPRSRSARMRVARRVS